MLLGDGLSLMYRNEPIIVEERTNTRCSTIMPSCCRSTPNEYQVEIVE